MTSRIPVRVLALAVPAILGLLALSCGKRGGVHLLVPNQRPIVEITSAPVSTSDTAFYAYRISWSGYDPDGLVDHYTYATDPTDTDTLWQATNKREATFLFRSTVAVLPGRPGQPGRGVDAHTFVIKAWDNSGSASAPRFRSFFSYTVAPTVQITEPVPIGALLRNLTTSPIMNWFGDDPDGQLTQKPVKYKYKLLARGNTEFSYDLARMKPDSLRRFYALTNFASWDSVGGDTTHVQFTGLVPGQMYLFVVIAYDEAGAYSPLFSLTTNMLQFQVGSALALGPRITFYVGGNAYYQQPYSMWTPDDPASWIRLELPAGRTLTFNWGATTTNGYITYYRWRVGGDVFDETPRTDEATDQSHWSAKSLTTTSCTIGPFTPNQAQLVYIEAGDSNDLRSLVTFQFNPIRPDFSKSVLIVDDTRAEVDQVYAPGSPNFGLTYPYTSIWPSAAELDTFLYARGGVSWRGTQVPSSAPVQPVSPPGLFAGYEFDTLGTRKGYQLASAGVPLSFLGHYKHVIWFDDHNSSLFSSSPTDPRQPMSTLHWMCTPNHENNLGAYMNTGGSVWLSGGRGAFESLREYDAKGVNDNNTQYGVGRTVFSFAKNELVPGRLMYDAAHWQSELVCQTVGITVTTVRKSTYVPWQPWSMPGFEFRGTVTSPDYTHIPATLRIKSLALGDTLPPTRATADQSKFYSIPQFDAEYMTGENFIIENIDPNPDTPHLVSVLDTLMGIRGSGLANAGEPEYPTMTYYHGVQRPDFIFSGFPIWLWTRSDCMSLIDFVMQDIWMIPRLPVPRAPQAGVRPPVRGVPGTRTVTPARLPATRR